MGAKIFSVKASELGKRWDVSFHVLSELPLPREAKRLEQLAQLKQGTSVPSSKYLDYSAKDGLLYIRISDISNGQIFGEAAKRIPLIFGKVRLKTGDILLSIRGSIGKTALVTEKFEGTVPSSQLVVVRSRKHVVNRKYLFRALSSKIVQKQLDYLKVGQVISYVTMLQLRRLLIPFPSLQEQVRIADKIEELEKGYAKTSEERERIKQEIDRIFEVDVY